MIRRFFLRMLGLAPVAAPMAVAAAIRPDQIKWLVPAGVRRVRASMGAGGCGGATLFGDFAVVPGQTYTITVGAGGSGGSTSGAAYGAVK